MAPTNPSAAGGSTRESACGGWSSPPKRGTPRCCSDSTRSTTAPGTATPSQLVGDRRDREEARVAARRHRRLSSAAAAGTASRGLDGCVSLRTQVAHGRCGLLSAGEVVAPGGQGRAGAGAAIGQRVHRARARARWESAGPASGRTASSWWPPSTLAPARNHPRPAAVAAARLADCRRRPRDPRTAHPRRLHQCRPRRAPAGVTRDARATPRHGGGQSQPRQRDIVRLIP